MQKNIYILLLLGIISFQSCKDKNVQDATTYASEEGNCPTQVKDSLQAQITLDDLKNLIKADQDQISTFMEEHCFEKASFGKNLYTSDPLKVDSLKIKNVKQGVFFLNKISAIDISQEIVYKVQYSFPIKFLNLYKHEIEKKTKKANFYRSNSVATNEDFKITYEIDRWDNKNLINSYSYQIDSYDGFAKLTIFYSEDLPVD